jgi:hypothetical protein
MICYDLKTVIIEYVHDDDEIRRIHEWVKVCQWNRSNLIKLIKYKNWREDYDGEIKLPLLYETVKRYNHDFYKLEDVYDFINYYFHITDDMYKNKVLGQPFVNELGISMSMFGLGLPTISIYSGIIDRDKYAYITYTQSDIEKKYLSFNSENKYSDKKICTTETFGQYLTITINDDISTEEYLTIINKIKKMIEIRYG